VTSWLRLFLEVAAIVAIFHASAAAFGSWPPALLHFVVQGTVKLVVVSGEAAPMFALAWMAASAILPLVVFVVPRPAR
jgi:hypothetical protein